MRNILIDLLDPLILCKHLAHDLVCVELAPEISIDCQLRNRRQFLSIGYAIPLDVSRHMLDQVIEISQAIEISEFWLCFHKLLFEFVIGVCEICDHESPAVIFTWTELLVNA